MPRRSPNPAYSNPTQFFTKELSGETPPSLSTMERLYGLASELFAQRPWHLLDESELVLIRDSAMGETCYCSVMGALGEVLAMHAYVGGESYRLFRRLAAAEVTSVGEFFGSQHSVYVEFVPNAELDGQDRKLLAALGHPLRAAKIAPLFRTIRPGYHPWYVTEEEARTLAECIRAVIAICSIASTQEDLDYWDQDDIYPQVSWVDGEGGKPQCDVKLVEAVLPSEPPLSPVPLRPEQLRRLRNRDYAVGGVMELDYFLSAAMIGEKNERKACVRIALAVNADSGIAFPPEIARPEASAGEALVIAIINAIETSRTLPREVKVQSSRFKDCLNPISDVCGFSIQVVRSLPALENARAELLRMLGDPGFPDR